MLSSKREFWTFCQNRRQLTVSIVFIDRSTWFTFDFFISSSTKLGYYWWFRFFQNKLIFFVLGYFARLILFIILVINLNPRWSLSAQFLHAQEMCVTNATSNGVSSLTWQLIIIFDRFFISGLSYMVLFHCIGHLRFFSISIA